MRLRLIDRIDLGCQPMRRQILLERRGSMYDPLIVDKFVSVHSSIRQNQFLQPCNGAHSMEYETAVTILCCCRGHHDSTK